MRRNTALAMQRVLPLGAVLLCAAGLASAGGSGYFEQTVTTGPIMGQPGSTAEQKLWISPTGYRLEDGKSGVTSILRADTGKVFILNNTEKSYTEMTLEQMKAMAGMGAAMLGQKGDAKAEVTKTDETAQIAGVKAYKIVVNITGGMTSKMVMWLSKDVDIDMSSWARLAEGMGLKGILGDAVEKIAAFEGYPVKQETEVTMMGMKMTTTTEVKSFKAGPVDAALFEVPKGYTKTEGFPGAPAGVGAGAQTGE